MSLKNLDALIAHAKNTGFIFQSSEIYGGLSSTFDYGPMGVELKNNVKKAWWQKFITENPYNVGLDAAILMNPLVWQASGHLSTFADPLMDCRHCKSRFRADQLIEEVSKGKVDATKMTNEQMEAYIAENQIACPHCGKHDFTPIRQFNLMFKTFQGVVEDAKNTLYLRPETAQGIFVNFKNVQRATRKKIPFGIGQIGKSFRNEITPGNFTFRTREFEQMEMEFFCEPGKDLEWYEHFKHFCMNWLLSLGLSEENLRLREHSPQELAFYSKGTSDIEYRFPFGWGELWGIADRTDYDLARHQECSKQNLEYQDPNTGEKYLPYCVEPAVGVDRLVLTFLCEAYEEEQLVDDVRTVLHLHPFLAPYKVAVLPLSKQLNEPALDLYRQLLRLTTVTTDDTGSIGKRYRRQDAVGTPYCLTYDFDSENDGCVTLRDRDTMEQERIPISEVEAVLLKKLRF
ncbi:MAG: glycine--tRNA ligase [Erysipelotrichaceae bacterium]|jgi:glycyl-tRNA synthetase|nr:glycine--tRNA ligase [Erysipelotrichaceae bacterium]